MVPTFSFANGRDSEETLEPPESFRRIRVPLGDSSPSEEVDEDEEVRVEEEEAGGGAGRGGGGGSSSSAAAGGGGGSGGSSWDVAIVNLDGRGRGEGATVRMRSPEKGGERPGQT